MQKVARKAAGNTLRQQLVSQVLELIFSGELRGGDRLIEEELAAKLGVSRTPIREALGELAAIGVIRLRPNHGAIVAPFGPKQITEIYHIRRILEVEATRLAGNSLDRGALEHVRAETQRLLDQSDRSDAWAENALALDQEFHMVICRSSGSERLAEEIGKYRNLVIAVGNAVGNKLHAHDQNMAEHMAVIDHLLANRPTDAATAMSRHIDRGAATAVEALGLVHTNGGGKST